MDNNIKLLLVKVTIACMRFKDDPQNPKRIITLDNLIEEIRRLSDED